MSFDSDKMNKKSNQESIGLFQNSHQCSNDKIIAWCIPAEYDQEIEPWKFKGLTNSSFPWDYDFTFHTDGLI